jgi:hypothetical protein
MDRLNWFFQELVGQADLNTWEDNQENADHNVVADILGFGFLTSGTNPATVVQNTVPDLNVKVNELLGYDQAGRRLSSARSGFEGGVNKGVAPQLIDVSVDEVAASTAVAGVGNEKTISIFVKFTRNPSTPRTDGNNATVYFNQDESVSFQVVQSAEAPVGTSVPPPLRNDQLLLCDIVRAQGQTTIVNANISQSRRQAFELLLPHGSSHISTGSDPIPAATTTVGGLLGAGDKTLINAGNSGAVATTIAVASNGAALPQATINVASTTGFASSGTAQIVTSAGIQYVAYTGLTGTSFTGCTGGSGTMATGGAVSQGFPAWVGEMLPNQYGLHKPATITAPSASTLDVTSRFVGIPAGGSSTKEGVVTQSGSPDNLCYFLDASGNEIKSAAGNRLYGRLTVDSESAPTAWTLHFYTEIAGVETADDLTGTPLAGATLTWVVTRSYRLDHLPTNLKWWLLNRNLTASIPAAKAAKNGAGTTNPEPVLNFIEGTNITMTVADDSANGRINITINSSAAGGFPGFGSATNPDTAGGSGGGSGLSADAGHAHSATTIYRPTAKSTAGSANPLPTTSLSSLGIALFAVAAIAGADGSGGQISVGFYTADGQGSVNLSGGGANNFNGVLAAIQSGNNWTGSGIGTNTITATSGGTNRTTNYALLALGAPH